MSIATRIESIEEHIEDAYNWLEGLGADLTNVNKNIENISMVLDDIYDSMPQVSGEGTSLTLDDTRVGKIKSTLKGNTSQSGTPTPTSPIPVNVVSGDNTIKVEGKNLLKYPYLNTTSTVSGVTFTDNGDGSITIDGTSTSSTYSLWFLYENAWNYNNLSFELNPGTYTFKGLTTNKVTMACNFYFSDNSNEYFSIAQNDVTKTITNKVRLNMRILVNGGTTVDNVTIYPQIEVGSSSSSFEPYNGNTYPINLGVKNLFDKSTANLNKGVATANGGLYNSDINFSTDYIEVKTNGTYYTASGVSSVANRVYGAQYDSNKQYVGAISTNVGNRTFYISNTNTKYIRLTGLLEEIDTYQIEEGSKQNSYTPYGTTPIELCKIGNYQDYIYKENGNWYISQAIIKRVYNGTENWSKSSNTSVDRFLKGEAFSALTGGYCDKYPVSNNVNTEINRLFLNAGTQVVINFSSYGTTTLEQFKTWLSSNNVTLYFVRSNSIAIEITYQPLIDQLNALELALSKNGQTNISQVNNDLPFIISASALKEWSV